MQCPICGNPEINVFNSSEADFSVIKCSNGHNFLVANDIFTADSKKKNRLFNLIASHIQKRPTLNGQFWRFYYDTLPIQRIDEKPENINLALAEKTYPNTFIEKVNYSLLNLSLYFPNYDDIIDDNCLVRRATFCNDSESESETIEFLEHLFDLGYLKRSGHYIFQLSSDAWIKIDELIKQSIRKKQGFIAIQYGIETEEIQQTIKTAISDAQFTPMIIAEKEHNNQIVPEIFYEIQNSSFLVVDITFPNYGAYYEAGYAQGLGIEVIVCCNKDIIDHPEKYDNRPHFDISQKNMVPWKDMNDLKKRLKTRIEATVNLKVI